MATRFIQEAEAQLNPVYQQQEQAIKSQIPAIQQLYQSLLTGLEGTRASETQKILESSASRGLTRSSIPTDLQTALGQSILQQQGQLGAQQAKELAGINTQLGDLGLQRAQGINSLADTLYQRDLKEREFQMQQQQAERDYQMKLQLARSSGGGGSKAATGPNPVQLVAAGLANMAGPDGKVSPETWRKAANQWVAGGYGSVTDFNKKFGNFINQSHAIDYVGR